MFKQNKAIQPDNTTQVKANDAVAKILPLPPMRLDDVPNGSYVVFPENSPAMMLSNVWIKSKYRKEPCVVSSLPLENPHGTIKPLTLGVILTNTDYPIDIAGLDNTLMNVAVYPVSMLTNPNTIVFTPGIVNKEEE